MKVYVLSFLLALSQAPTVVKANCAMYAVGDEYKLEETDMALFDYEAAHGDRPLAEFMLEACHCSHCPLKNSKGHYLEKCEEGKCQYSWTTDLVCEIKTKFEANRRLSRSGNLRGFDCAKDRRLASPLKEGVILEGKGCEDYTCEELCGVTTTHMTGYVFDSCSMDEEKCYYKLDGDGSYGGDDTQDNAGFGGNDAGSDSDGGDDTQDDADSAGGDVGSDNDEDEESHSAEDDGESDGEDVGSDGGNNGEDGGDSLPTTETPPSSRSL